MLHNYKAQIRFLLGPVLTAIVVGAVEAGRISEFTIPNPQLFTAVAITFAAYSSGYRGGLLAAAIGVGYAFYFFSTPGALFSYTDAAAVKVLVNCLTLPMIAILVSELNYKYKKSIDQEMGVFFQRANAPVFSIDSDGYVVSWNDYLEKLIGYSEKDVLNRIFQDHEVFNGGAELSANEVNLNPAFWNAELHEISLRSKAGKPIDLLASATPQRDEHGRITGLVCIGQDNTAHKQAEKLLSESRQRYRSLVDLSPDGIMVHRDDNILFCNQSMATQLGAESPEQIIGRSTLEFTLPEERALMLERRRAALSGQKVGMRETAYVRLDGERINVERTPAAVQWEDEEAILVLSRDISERKNAEMQLRQIVGSLQDGFVLYDDKDRLVMWNAKWAELYKEVADLIKVGACFEDLVRANVMRKVYPVPAGEEEESIRERIRQRRNLGDPIIRQLTDGRWIITREARTADGGTFTINTDISDIKNAENAAHEARERAEEADKSKSEFLANMSHELRTPLNAIIGFSAAMEKESFGPIGNQKYLDYLKYINQSGQHLLSLISDILDLSKVESGVTDLHEEIINVADTARAAIGLVRERALKDGIDLDLQAADDLPALRADARKLNQVLFNLLTNAIKFTEAGGKVTLGVHSSAERGYVFEVFDTGIGIAPENIAKVMSKFGQVDSALTRRHEGTGLGLPLTKALVEQHGGSFEIASELGAGTRVTVCFPVCRIVKADTRAITPPTA